MGKAPPSRKYGAPLYAAAWPTGSTVYVAGGGGKKSSGMKNRVVAAVVQGQALSEEVAALELEDCPIRMVSHPAGRLLVLALGGGGLCRVDLTVPEHGGAPLLALAAGEEAERLAKLPVAKCLAFSGDGRHLAVGGEDASVTVLDWSTALPRTSITAEGGLKDGVRDLDFSAAHQNRVLAVACEDGSCGLWDWEKGTLLLALQLPDSLRGGSFSRCRFARDGSMGLFTVVAHRGDGYVLHWEQNEEGDVVLKRQVRVASSPITAFDIGSKGTCLAIGTSEGEVFAWSAQSLARLRRVKSAHMVFATAAVMAPDERTLLSVSADASAVATGVRKARRGHLLGRLTAMLLLVLVAIVWYISSLRNVRDLGDVQHLVEELSSEGDL